jgi:hypothetical protein
MDAAAGVSFSGWRLEAPEREVDTRPDRTRRLGNRMRIVALRLSSHDEEVARAKIPARPFATCPMLQHEAPPIPEADRRDGRSWTELGLVIAVIAH